MLRLYMGLGRLYCCQFGNLAASLVFLKLERHVVFPSPGEHALDAFEAVEAVIGFGHFFIDPPFAKFLQIAQRTREGVFGGGAIAECVLQPAFEELDQLHVGGIFGFRLCEASVVRDRNRKSSA